jgi:hypothetical protein
MDATSADSKKASQPKGEPSLSWTSLRDFVLLTLALSGGFVLMDLYASGQGISKYLLHGAFISACIVLGQAGMQRILRSKTSFHPGD